MDVIICCSGCGRKLSISKEVFDWFKSTPGSKIICDYCTRKKTEKTKQLMLVDKK